MNTRLTYALAIALLATVPAFAGLPSNGRVQQVDTARFPESTALRTDLTTTETDLRELALRLDRAKKSIAAARQKVNDASSLVRLIAATDDSMGRVVKELRSLSKVPKLGVLGPIATNLEKVKKDVHAVREKADKFDREVLKPLAKRLTVSEQRVSLAATECNTSATKAKLAAAGVGVSQQLIGLRGYPTAEVAALERSAKTAGVVVAPLAKLVTSVEQATAGVEKKVVALGTSVGGVNSLRAGFEKFAKSLDPFDKAAGSVNKVLSKRLSVKLFGKEYGFTVRQVLEGPSKIGKAILKPLQALADKAITAVLKKLKLEIQTPKVVRDLNAKLAAATKAATTIDADLAAFEKALAQDALAKFETAVAPLAKK